MDVSVIVPTYNVAREIEDQLAALAQQRYDGSWEIVVSDNGSTDATVALVRSWADRLPNLTVVDSSARRGASHARNVGAEAATGDLLVFCDADDVASQDWLQEMVNAAADADLVGGALDHELLNRPEAQAWRGCTGQSNTPPPLGFLPFALSGNLAVRAEVWRALGGFRTDYHHCEDVDFSWRAQLSGYRLAHATSAVIHYRHRKSLWALAWQVYNYGRAEACLYRQYRDHRARRRGARQLARSYLYPVIRAPYVAMSRRHRGLWLVVASENCGRIVGSVQERVICP